MPIQDNDNRSSTSADVDNSTDWDTESKRVEEAVKQLVEKPGIFFDENISEKGAPQANTDITEICGTANKSISDYLAIHKSLVQKQQNTMAFYKGFAERRIEKLGKLIGKQEEINSKIQRQENKAAKFENKIARLSETNKMLSSLFENKKTPAVISFLMERNEKRIAKLHDKKIPRNNLKMQKLQGKSARNHIKMERTIAKADKLQALSSVIKSFAVLEPTKRREQFSAAMDDLHSASERAVMCKIEKCDIKLAYLKSTLPEKQTDYTISDIDTEEKIQRLEAKRNVLTQKLDKLQSLQQPFSELNEEKTDILINDVKEKADETVQTIENEKQCSDLAEDIAVCAVEKANALSNENNITAEQSAKTPAKEQKKQTLDERLNKARADNPQPTVKAENQHIKQEQSL